MRMPSQRRMLATLALGRTVRSSGMITVGPVTVTSAPNSSASAGGRSMKNQAAAAMISQLSSAPKVTMLRTTSPWPRISRTRNVSAPSKRITATPSETSGKSRSPNSASGRTSPVAGPAIMPISSRMRMAGSFSHHASHCAPMPSRQMIAMMSPAFSGMWASLPCRLCSRADRPGRSLRAPRPRPRSPPRAGSSGCRAHRIVR